MWVEFVVGSVLCSESFFSPGTPVFHSFPYGYFGQALLSTNLVMSIVIILYVV